MTAGAGASGNINMVSVRLPQSAVTEDAATEDAGKDEEAKEGEAVGTGSTVKTALVSEGLSRPETRR